jgi:WD40 repeat protein
MAGIRPVPDTHASGPATGPPRARAPRPTGLPAVLGLALLALVGSAPAPAQQDLKLLVDDGRYHESEWTTQLAVSADERYLVSSDIENGIKLWDLESGRLLNAFEGHSLEGDAYFDPRTQVLVTTGDRKIKVWDLAGERPLKTIRQDFHSQFMNDVYVDGRRQYLFAERVKYAYESGRVQRTYDRKQYPTMYFHQDKYYVFDPARGTIARYDCYTDKLESTLTLTDYVKSDGEHFNQDKGVLFLAYGNGIRAVDLTTGASEIILFERSGSFANLDRNEAFDWTADRRFLVAGSNQSGGHLVILEKIDPARGFEGNAREVLRRKVEVGEVLCLRRTPRCVYSTDHALTLLDVPSQRVVWESAPRIDAVSEISLSRDGRLLNLAFGTQPRVNRHGFERDFTLPFDRYFDPIDEHWGRFKEGLRAEDLPPELRRLWQDRLRLARIRLDQGFTLLPFPAGERFETRGTEATPYDPVDGAVSSPSGRYRVSEKSFGTMSVYDGDKPIATASNTGVVYHVEFSPSERYTAFGGSGRRVPVVDLQRRKVLHTLNAESYVTTVSFSNDERSLFTGSLKNEILMWDLQSGKLVRRFLGSNGSIRNTEVSADDKLLISVADDGALRFWKIATGELLLSVFYDYVGGHVAFTPSGHFEKSEDFDAVLWRKGGRTYAFEQFFEDFFRPGLLAEVTGAEVVPRPEVRLSDRLAESPPPSVAITAPQPGQRFTAREIEVVVAVTDTGGGVDEVRLTHNGKAIAGKERGVTLTVNQKSGEQRFRITLLEGENVIAASAFSKARIESATYRLAVHFDGTTPTADAHIVAIGINKYRNSRYDLNYARADAEGVLRMLTERGQALFRQVHVYPVFDAEATAEGIRAALGQVTASARPQDVLAFYYAGHGVTGKDARGQLEFFIVPTEITQLYDEEALRAHAIAASELVELSRAIQAQKQVFILDACESGGVERAFARRGAAEEKALAQLARAAGVHVLASTGTEQFATEFAELGHGLFTYVMIDALKGAADGAPRDGKLTVHELKAYVEDRVPEMTQRYRGELQYPVTYSRGNDFPLLLPGG